MDKQAKPKNKLLKLLPRAASGITFQNIPFSPGKRSDHGNTNKPKTHIGKGFSGPMVSMIPAEARRKSKNSSFEAQEPTSPKHRKKMSKDKHASMPKEFKPFSTPPPVKNKPSTIKPVSSPAEVKKKPSTIRNIFGGGAKQAGRKSDASADKSTLRDRAPNMSQMSRFASGRDAFANFDWKATQISPEDSNDHRNYFSDDEREESDGEDEVIIPFSAPIIVNKYVSGVLNLEPRKEINIWKRRTMAQPTPLRVNTLVRTN
ncbi:unnamed protein product [Ilex paraguariensis]|uniref:Syringolide-induced protein 14-1-1 n=1 Tax=Ilex paraguariensis TaxID=185542 RepID=A0ABC8V532_9AQUA